jgi:hypothetical protein
MLIGLLYLKKARFARNMSIEFELQSIKHEHNNERDGKPHNNEREYKPHNNKREGKPHKEQ